MHYAGFLDLISKQEQIELPGLEAQKLMIPKQRLRLDRAKIERKQPKQAGVLALFYPGEDELMRLLLTERPSYGGTHSAQISFPGGKFEHSDKNLEETALRETEEEVGLMRTQVKVVRKLTQTYIPPSNFMVSPFLGYTSFTPRFETSEEVESLIEVSFKDLMNPENLGVKSLKTSYMDKVDVPCFLFGEHVVWGATAMMLSEVRELFVQSLD